MTQFTGTSPNIPILHEDNHLMVVNKPVNLLSQQDHTADPDLVTLCKAYLKRRYNKPGNAYIGLVHRLDRPVGGTMVMAKTSKAASRLSEQIRNREIRKRYLLVAHGKTPPNGVLVHHLLKNSETNRVEVLNTEVKKSLRAELSYLRQAYLPDRNLSLVRVNLITGRPHQIRVQFSFEGHPIVGDIKYGIPDEGSSGPALFASGIGFSHPISGKSVSFKCEPPQISPWNYFGNVTQ